MIFKELALTFISYSFIDPFSKNTSMSLSLAFFSPRGYEYINSMRLYSDQTTRLGLPIISKLVLSLIVVHEVGPEIKDRSNVRELLFLGFSLDIYREVVVLAALFLLQ